LLFQRNVLVFSLDQAKETIRQGGSALLVEGLLDVIQLHQAGFTNAVACLGTILSPLQLQLLQRHGTKQLLIALDGDSAGQSATERLLIQLLPQLSAGALGATVVPLPQGQDADGLLRSQGKAALDALLAGSRHWLEWRLERLLAPLAALNPGGEIPLEILQQVEREGQALIKQLSDGMLRRTAEQPGCSANLRPPRRRDPPGTGTATARGLGFGCSGPWL
jgi:DNA primase